MEEYVEHAKAVALEAGGIMTEYFGLSTPFARKEDNSPITEADTRINDLVLARLSAAYPEHSLMGEEGQDLKESEYVWVFDPIDGTVPFLRGVPTNVFALALVQNGEPVLGVVYDPYMKRLYHAVKGGGAFMNDEPIRTSARTDLARSYVESDGHKGFKNFDFLLRFREADIRLLSYSSIVYAHMLVASGQIEAVVFPKTKPWDSAAAKVIIEEAGGVTSDIHGNEQRYDTDTNGFISACNAEYHAKLLALIAPSV